MKQYDYLIVGAGFAGAVLAERLNSIGNKVCVIDRRPHIGGNCYDYYNEIGVLVHKYGPHYFRTDSEKVFRYLSGFTKWRPYEYRIRSCVNGKLYPIPINRDTINLFFNKNFKTDEEVEEFLKMKRHPIEEPANAEEHVLAKVGQELYDGFFKNYTKKQWDINPKQLDASVTARIPLRTNTDDRYFNSKYQCMPLQGYFKLFENMLEGIQIELNTDFDAIKNQIKFEKLIYTGPIDEFFNYKYGKLPYRSLKFEFVNIEKEYYQDWSQINYPNDHNFTRIVEIKHATGQKCQNTTIVKEYPCNGKEPFYPVPNSKNQLLYMKYQKEAQKLKNVIFVGRLATYRYLNMDQVVQESLDVFGGLTNERSK